MDDTNNNDGTAAEASGDASLSVKPISQGDVLRAQMADLQKKLDAVEATEDFKAHLVDAEGNPHADQYSMDSGLARASGQAIEARLRAGNFPGWQDASTTDAVASAKAALDAGNLIDAAIYAFIANANG